MKITTIALMTLLISGCSLTPIQKKVIAITGTALVFGAIAAHDDDSQGLDQRDIGRPNDPCSRNPDPCR
jgi:hypothetical protein